MGLSAPVQALLQLLISWRFSGKSGGKPVLASFPFLHREHVCKCAAARGSRVGWGAPWGSSTQSALRLGYSTTQNCCLMTPVSRTHRAAVQDCQWFLRSPLPLGGLNLLGKNINSKGRETRKFVIFKQGLQVRGFRLRNKTESGGPFLASPPVLGLHVWYVLLGFFFLLCMPYGTKERSCCY